jgi:hypothetical protein
MSVYQIDMLPELFTNRDAAIQSVRLSHHKVGITTANAEKTLAIVTWNTEVRQQVYTIKALHVHETATHL